MTEIEFPILTVLIVLPLLGIMPVALSRDLQWVKKITAGIAILELLLALAALYWFKPDIGNNFQLVEHAQWIPSLNVDYFLGIDGISVLFLPLTALVTLFTLVATWNTIQVAPRLHYSFLLALEGISMGVFCALDLVLFFLFWELTLPVLFFLISLWGVGPNRRGAAIKYVLFMLCGGVPLLFAIIMLAINHADFVQGHIPQDLSFSFPVLLETPLQDHWQSAVFLLLLAGFAVKAPMMPFHTWLPAAAMEGPIHVTALLIGLKLGVYGIIRFTMTLAPLAAVEYSWALGIVGAITLLYSALIALQQTNLRRLLAYASVSHVGLVMIGISALNLQGVQGALFQLFNFGLISASLMLIAGFIQHRLGSTEAIHLGGLAKVLPKLTAFYFLFLAAAIGIPGTSGFPAELLLIISGLTSHPSIGLAALVGAVLAAAYMVSFSRRAFWGAHNPVSTAYIQDLRLRELLLLMAPGLLVLFFGFFPNKLLKTTQVATEAWITRLFQQPGMEFPERRGMSEEMQSRELAPDQ